MMMTLALLSKLVLVVLVAVQCTECISWRPYRLEQCPKEAELTIDVPETATPGTVVLVWNEQRVQVYSDYSRFRLLLDRNMHKSSAILISSHSKLHKFFYNEPEDLSFVHDRKYYSQTNITVTAPLPPQGKDVVVGSQIVSCVPVVNGSVKGLVNQFQLNFRLIRNRYRVCGGESCSTQLSVSSRVRVGHIVSELRAFVNKRRVSQQNMKCSMSQLNHAPSLRLTASNQIQVIGDLPNKQFAINITCIAYSHHVMQQAFTVTPFTVWRNPLFVMEVVSSDKQMIASNQSSIVIPVKPLIQPQHNKVIAPYSKPLFLSVLKPDNHSAILSYAGQHKHVYDNNIHLTVRLSDKNGEIIIRAQYGNSKNLFEDTKIYVLMQKSKASGADDKAQMKMFLIVTSGCALIGVAVILIGGILLAFTIVKQKLTSKRSGGASYEKFISDADV